MAGVFPKITRGSRLMARWTSSNAALGLARATVREDFLRENLLAIQKDLVVLMGELAVLPEDLPRYMKDGYSPRFRRHQRIELVRSSAGVTTE